MYKRNQKKYLYHQNNIPRYCKILYCIFICDLQLHREEKYHTCLTADGKMINSFEDKGVLTISVLDSKINQNSTISNAH